MNKAILFWSSGKDSAATLAAVAGELEIEALVTTVDRPENRVTVHYVPEVLLDGQADAMGLPLEKIRIPSPCPNDDYERLVLASLRGWVERGVDTVVFGDINLADVRAYREKLLSRAGMRGVFPLWQRDTRELAEQEIDSGIRAVTTCVDSTALSAAYVGREFDRVFLASLPGGVDPCGENGEFHTFVWDAPVFAWPIRYSLTDTRDDGRFCYAIIDESTQEPDHGE